VVLSWWYCRFVLFGFMVGRGVFPGFWHGFVHFAVITCTLYRDTSPYCILISVLSGLFFYTRNAFQCVRCSWTIRLFVSISLGSADFDIIPRTSSCIVVMGLMYLGTEFPFVRCRMRTGKGSAVSLGTYTLRSCFPDRISYFSRGKWWFCSRNGSVVWT